MTLTPQERSQNARRAALVRSSRYDGTSVTRAARRTFLDSFAPDDPGMDPAERERRARAALRAHMIALSAKAARARRALARADEHLQDVASTAEDIARLAV